MGEIMFDKSEHVPNNCTLCKFFISYEDDYFDEFEPSDMGFCQNSESGHHSVNPTITCHCFKPVEP